MSAFTIGVSQRCFALSWLILMRFVLVRHA